mmetsp:Transcript_19372/g.27064  ORF Transcript_19372/g.27064 Transcript_19372/m.27064 type:complete len:176 (-) Transcript_19372:43-570(-)
MALADCIFIFCCALGSALFAEGMAWLLVYRTDSYIRTKEMTEKLAVKLESKKAILETAGISTKKQLEKKIAKYDEALKTAQKEMGAQKMKSTFFVGFIFIALFAVLNSSYDGIPVATLPFEPVSFLRGFTHRGLAGTNFYECSMAFFYFASSLSIRSNIQRYLGVVQPKPQFGTS